MISMALQRDVPQYIAIPWLITWVMALTVSTNHNRVHTQSISYWSDTWFIIHIGHIQDTFSLLIQKNPS